MGNINTQSSVQFIEYNKGNHTILNQIYDILAEFQTKEHKSYYAKFLHI